MKLRNYLTPSFMVLALAIAGSAITWAAPGHKPGKAEDSQRNSLQNPLGDGHKMPMRVEGSKMQGMPGNEGGEYKMPMQGGTKMKKTQPGEKTLAEAKRCRKQMLDGTEVMDEQQIESCVNLGSLFNGAAGGKVVTIRMKTDSNGRNYFEPARVEINRGDTVKWVLDSGVHNSAAYPNRIPWDTMPWEFPLMTKPGDSYTRTYFSAGSYEYHCHPHEAVGMKGVVVVERMSLASEFRRSSKAESAHAHH